jgi:hypothetical protein
MWRCFVASKTDAAISRTRHCSHGSIHGLQTNFRGPLLPCAEGIDHNNAHDLDEARRHGVAGLEAQTAARPYILFSQMLRV